jgi:hypothetical protein
LINPAARGRLYARHAAAADREHWSVERDIRWSEIDRGAARSRPAILFALRDAAIIKSYRPVNVTRTLRLVWDDIDAGVVLSLELYEGFKHFHALRTYLDAVGHEPAITDAELVAARHTAIDDRPGEDDVIQRLVQFMLSEHLSSYFFRRLGEQSTEPVLTEMVSLIAADEGRHAQSASDLIAARIADDAAVVPRVLDAAAHVHHLGEEVIGERPVARTGDAVAVRTFVARIERLCGVRGEDQVKGAL